MKKVSGKMVAVYLPFDVVKALKAAAKKQQTSQSAITAEALRIFLQVENA